MSGSSIEQVTLVLRVVVKIAVTVQQMEWQVNSESTMHGKEPKGPGQEPAPEIPAINMVAEHGSRSSGKVERQIAKLEEKIQMMAQQINALEANVNESVGRSVLTNVRVNRLTKRFEEAEVKRLSPKEDQQPLQPGKGVNSAPGQGGVTPTTLTVNESAKSVISSSEDWSSTSGESNQKEKTKTDPIVSEQFNIPVGNVKAVIGPHGDRINKIKEMTKVKQIELNDDVKTFTIVGTEGQVKAAKQLMKDIIEGRLEAIQETTVTTQFSSKKIREVIGPKGSIIKMIQDVTRTHIEIKETLIQGIAEAQVTGPKDATEEAVKSIDQVVNNTEHYAGKGKGRGKSGHYARIKHQEMQEKERQEKMERLKQEKVNQQKEDAMKCGISVEAWRVIYKKEESGDRDKLKESGEINVSIQPPRYAGSHNWWGVYMTDHPLANPEICAAMHRAERAIKNGQQPDPWPAKSAEVKLKESPFAGVPLMPPGIPQPANSTVLTQSNSNTSIWTTPSSPAPSNATSGQSSFGSFTGLNQTSPFAMLNQSGAVTALNQSGPFAAVTKSEHSASIWATPSTHTWPTTPGEKSEAQLKHEKLWPTIPWNEALAESGTTNPKACAMFNCNWKSQYLECATCGLNMSEHGLASFGITEVKPSPPITTPPTTFGNIEVKPLPPSTSIFASAEVKSSLWNKLPVAHAFSGIVPFGGINQAGYNIPVPSSDSEDEGLNKGTQDEQLKFGGSFTASWTSLI